MKNTIIHYDMDSFYASVEIRDNPKLKGKPIVVGQTIVTTASYEARKFGVHSAMPVAEARRLCPNLTVVPVSKGKYGKISEEIQNLVRMLTNKVEFIALDEGYVDVTNILDKYPTKEYFAKRFQNGIWNNVNLTCSVGVGYNKLSAKIASDINKPGGIHIFNNRQEFVEWISKKPIKIIPGVGKKMVEKLTTFKMEKVEDVYKYSLTELVSMFGNSSGERLHLYSRGYDYREVDYKRKTHSIGNENTFRYKLETSEEIIKELDILFAKTFDRLSKKNFLCKTLTIKVRFQDRKTITRSKSFNKHIQDRIILYDAMTNLIEDVVIKGNIGLLGVSFGNLSKVTSRQLTFNERERLKKKVDIELLKEKINTIQKKG